MDKPFVYVANLGKYNEGELVGTFLHLPMKWDEIERKLHEEALIGTCDCFGQPYEEYAIHDFDTTDWMEATGWTPNEYSSLRELNALYAIVDACEDNDDAISAYTESFSSAKTQLDVANLVMQGDRINFTPNMSASDYGRELFEMDCDCYDVPKGFVERVEGYIDFEDYCKGDDVAFVGGGLLRSYDCDVDMNKYDWDDVLDEIERNGEFTREDLGYADDEDEEDE